MNLPKLNSNQLKIIAAILMVFDHIGYFLFPEKIIFRIIGRLSFPIFAYFIAQGCYHTKSISKYFLTLFLLGLICTIVTYLAQGELYCNILITFSLSVLMISCVKENVKLLPLAAVFIICLILTERIPVDYGLSGILVPFLTYLGILHQKERYLFFLALLLVALSLGGIQYISLLSIPILMLYNGERGKWNLKYFFYLFYPLHIVIIQLFCI